MASTGVSVADSVAAEFETFKKSSNKITFKVYKIENKTTITTEFTSGEGESYSSFLSHLPADDCRYAIYNMDFTTNDGRPANKLVFISWAPDDANVKSKMLYAGSKDALGRVFVGVSVKVHGTDLAEISEAEIIAACRKFA